MVSFVRGGGTAALLVVLVFFVLVGVSAETTEEVAHGQHHNHVKQQDLPHQPEVFERRVDSALLGLEVNNLHVNENGELEDEVTAHDSAIAAPDLQSCQVEKELYGVNNVQAQHQC